MSRQQTPDIMAGLMNSNSALIDGQQESMKAIKQGNNKNPEQKSAHLHSEELESNKTIEAAKNKAVLQDSNNEVKEKATFNLSLSTLESLEDAWVKLKRQLKGEQRITKTLIVEKAIEMALNELTTKENESEIFRRLIGGFSE